MKLLRFFVFFFYPGDLGKWFISITFQRGGSTKNYRSGGFWTTDRPKQTDWLVLFVFSRGQVDKRFFFSDLWPKHGLEELFGSPKLWGMLSGNYEQQFAKMGGNNLGFASCGSLLDENFGKWSGLVRDPPVAWLTFQNKTFNTVQNPCKLFFFEKQVNYPPIGSIYGIFTLHLLDLSVSKNRDTPKSSILIRCSIINHPFWGFSPYFWKHPFWWNVGTVNIQKNGSDYGP